MFRQFDVNRVGWPEETEVSCTLDKRSNGDVPTRADAEAVGSVVVPPKKALAGETSAATVVASSSSTKLPLAILPWSGKNDSGEYVRGRRTDERGKNEGESEPSELLVKRREQMGSSDGTDTVRYRVICGTKT